MRGAFQKGARLYRRGLAVHRGGQSVPESRPLSHVARDGRPIVCRRVASRRRGGDRGQPWSVRRNGCPGHLQHGRVGQAAARAGRADGRLHQVDTHHRGDRAGLSNARSGRSPRGRHLEPDGRFSSRGRTAPIRGNNLRPARARRHSANPRAAFSRTASGACPPGRTQSTPAGHRAGRRHRGEVPRPRCPLESGM